MPVNGEVPLTFIFEEQLHESSMALGPKYFISSAILKDLLYFAGTKPLRDSV